jgi:mannosyltransferase
MPVKNSDPTLLLPRVPSDPFSDEDVVPSPDEQSKPEPLEARWLTVLAWTIPFGLMAMLGLVRLDAPSLWEDELATWGMVNASWSDFWQVLANTDASIGPYYVAIRVWSTLFGTSDFALRVPSVLAMAGAAGLLSALGSRLAGRRVGLAAGMIFVALPTISRYAQEARPYALAVFAAVLATYLVVRLVERPSVVRYAAYGAAVALVGLFHVVALVLLAAHAMIVWRTRQRHRTIWWWLAAGAVGLLPTLPVLYLGSQQSATQIGWIPAITLDRVIAIPASIFGTPVLAGAVMALALLAMSMRRPALVATSWALLPAVALLVVSLVVPMWIARYLLFVAPAWVLLGSMTLRGVTIIRGIGAVTAIGLLAIPTQVNIRERDGHAQATSDIAAVILAHGLPGDVVVYGGFAEGDQRVSRDAVLRYLPTDARPADPLLSTPPRTGGSLGGEECLPRDVRVCLGKPPRIWVVRKGALDDPVNGMGDAKEVLLRADYTMVQTWRVKGFSIALLTRKPEADPGTQTD